MSSGGVHLRDVVEADLPVFFAQQNEPEANRMAAFPARDRDSFNAHWASKVLGDESVLKKTIVFDGEVAGNVVSFEKGGARLVGYWVGKEHWGRGVATRALSEFLGQIEERPLYAHVAKTNPASIRALQKCGFAFVREQSASPAAGDDDVDELIFELRGESG